ncbi:hypothetical protein, partial [Klebsiella pneumoniae]
RKRAYCLKIQPATGSFARNLIYSTKPYTPLRTLFAALLLVTSHAFSATVQDENGTFTFDKTPLRIFLNILILIALI